MYEITTIARDAPMQTDQIILSESINIPTNPNGFNPTSSRSTTTTPQAFCLRWNNYQTNLMTAFDQLLQNEQFVDVTLCCDGYSIKAHKMILSACSPYFEKLFIDNPCQHPIVILRDARWPELKAAVEFMYKGEINVSQNHIEPLLQLAQVLKIRGLADVGSSPSSDSTTKTTTTKPSGVSDNVDGTISASIPAQTIAPTTTTTTTAAASTTAIVDSTNDSIPTASASRTTTSTPLNTNTSNKENPSKFPSPKRSRLSDKEWDDCFFDLFENKHFAKLKKISNNEKTTDDNNMLRQNDTDEKPDEEKTLIDLSPFVMDKSEDCQNDNLIIDEEEKINPDIIVEPQSIPNTSTGSTPFPVKRLLRNIEHKRYSQKKEKLKKNYTTFLKLKPPSWTQIQLHDAINSVIMQKLRFTQASVRYNIPKGTLYDNILGKSNRMQVLDEAGLNCTDEKVILEFCCDSSFPPYNRRTKKSLDEIIAFIQTTVSKVQPSPFRANRKFCFRWWWAFCKKYSIVSLYYDSKAKAKKIGNANGK